VATARKPKKAATPALDTAAARTLLVSLLGEQGANALVGAAQVQTREARAIKVVVNSGEATKYGAVTIGKQTGKGFIPGVGIRKEDLEFVIGELTQALAVVNA
jgi:hypothetical protein